MNIQQTVRQSSIHGLSASVVLVSTANNDGSPSVMPIPSVLWMGSHGIFSVDAQSETAKNIIRTGECVLNLTSVSEVAAVHYLAHLNATVIDGAPRKSLYETQTFEALGLTFIASDTVASPRIAECPIQLESVLQAKHGLTQDDDTWREEFFLFEIRIKQVHVNSSILVDGDMDRIDPYKWFPLIVNFQKLCGLSSGQIIDLKIQDVSESTYLNPCVKRTIVDSLTATEIMRATYA